MRDLGEKSVGGKSMNLDDDVFEMKTVSKTRISNVAKAYGWWVAKDSVSLAILKVGSRSPFKQTIINAISTASRFHPTQTHY